MHIAKDQADFVIIQLARVLKEEFSNTVVIVLSCDYDFIALAPPKSVDALLDPTRNVILWKRDVLALLGVEEETLFIAYTLGGCDDISTNLRGVGFNRALLFAASHILLDSIMEEFDDYEEKDLVSLCGEIQALQSTLWEKEADTLERFHLHDEKSLLEKFAAEEDEFGSFRRPGFQSLYVAMVCGIYFDPLNSMLLT